MIAIALSGHEIRYIIWESEGEEVQLIACQVMPWEHEVDPFQNTAQIRNIIGQIIAESPNSLETPVFLTVDANFFHFSILEIDPLWDPREQLEFIFQNRFGENEPLYSSFQFPLAALPGWYLNIDCPAVFRRAFQSSLPLLQGNGHFLSVGVFSAYSYASRVVPALQRGRRLFWRASEHGLDHFLEIEDGEFKALHFFQRDETAVRHLSTVGKSHLQKPISSFIEEVSEGREAVFPEVENIFVYQGSGSPQFLERVWEIEQSTLSLMNPFWRWNWPDVPEADNRFTQSAFTELADAVWMARSV
jgi:hypothetical protein